MVIFGLIVLCEETKESIYNALKTFFSFHVKIKTETILTGLNPEYEKAVNQLIKEGVLNCTHLIDGQRAAQ